MKEEQVASMTDTYGAFPAGYFSEHLTSSTPCACAYCVFTVLVDFAPTPC